jgi:hypothetical protein
MYLAGQAPDDNPAMTSLILLIVGGYILLRFGLWIARWLRARDDYNRVKAGLPGMRKAKWALFRNMVKVGALLLFAYALLAVMAGRDAQRNVSDHPDSPAPATTSAGSRTR